MKKRLATVGLAVFLVADVALVALALRTPKAPPAEPPGATSSTPVALDQSPSTTGSSGGASYEPAPLTRVVVALDGRAAWRGSVGSCADGGAALQTTSDGGKTWTKPRSLARGMPRIQPLDAGSGFVYGMGEACAVTEYVTSDGGVTWEDRGTPTGIWSRSLRDPEVVATPEDEAARPCGDQAVVDLLRASTTRAQVLCLNGAVKTTTDGGAKWSATGTLPGGLALSGRVEDGSFVTYAARVTAACEGVEVARLVRDEPASVGCIETDASAKPGEISLSTPRGAGWLVAGEQTWTSSDLKAWTKA